MLRGAQRSNARAQQASAPIHASKNAAPAIVRISPEIGWRACRQDESLPTPTDPANGDVGAELESAPAPEAELLYLGE